MLNDSLRWNLGVRMTIRGKKQNDYSNFYDYQRIRHSVPQTDKVLVAVGTAGKPTWRYGGQVRVFINNTSPSSTSNFIGGIMMINEPLPVARHKFIDLSDYPESSYAIEIIPPAWFPYILVESWWFDNS